MPDYRVTPQDIAQLEALLAGLHATHAAEYGPQETCTESRCVQVKWGIAWLKETIPQES